jgi:hypothetical protein
LEEKSSTEGSLYFVAFAPNQNCHRHFSGKWWLWTTIAGPIASLMIEKYLRKK